jgi:hypothetical protein
MRTATSLLSCLCMQKNHDSRVDLSTFAQATFLSHWCPRRAKTRRHGTHRYKYQTMGTTAMVVQSAARRTAPLLQDDPEREVVVVAVVVDGVFCAATLGKANLVLVGVAAVGWSGSSGNAVGECVVVVVAGRSCVGDKDTVGVVAVIGDGDTSSTVTGGGQGQCCWTYGCKARQRSGATRRCAASYKTCRHDTCRPKKSKAACCCCGTASSKYRRRRNDAFSLAVLLRILLLPLRLPLPSSSSSSLSSLSLVRQENVQASSSSLYVGELVSVGDGVTVGMYVVTVVGCGDELFAAAAGVVVVVGGAAVLLLPTVVALLLWLVVVALLWVMANIGTMVEFWSDTGEVEVRVTVSSSHQHDTGNNDELSLLSSLLVVVVVVVLRGASRLLDEIAVAVANRVCTMLQCCGDN